MKAVPVTNSNWTPLSAIYKPDSNIEFYGNSVATTDGYTVYVQNVYKNPKDAAINKNTIVQLPESMGILDCIYDKGKPAIATGGQTNILVNINSMVYYIAINEQNELLYLDADPIKAASFRINVNPDKSLSFYCSVNKLVTVSHQEPLLLYLDAPLNTQQQYRQQFNYETFENDKITIITKGISRYWAYRNIGPNAYKIRANGYINNGSIINEYIFKIPNFKSIITHQMLGLTTDHHWVTYYNLLSNKENNRNVVLNEKQRINVQHLIDNPYHKTNLSKGTTEVNIANLKNIMTGEYGYEKL